MTRIPWSMRLLILRAAIRTAVTGRHVYVATSCIHGDHEYCSGADGCMGPKEPAVCKFCPAPCRCPHHAVT